MIGNSSPSVPQGSALESLMAASDAPTELASALVDHQLQLNQQGLRAAAFLVGFGQGDLLNEILRLRRYQVGTKNIVDGLKSVSLLDFMKGIQINLGGK